MRLQWVDPPRRSWRTLFEVLAIAIVFAAVGCGYYPAQLPCSVVRERTKRCHGHRRARKKHRHGRKAPKRSHR